MRKMKLQVDALCVETFDAGEHRTVGRGTVLARATGQCPQNTDYHYHSCDIVSCGGTCIITYIPCGTCGDSFDVCD